ncbi:MAG: hypothetical protein F9K22_04445 [Bacteroidetes bacterium]|nr:MAG: hypothetical protein F9K22_04445 [Bacteroidota bacterium]
MKRPPDIAAELMRNHSVRNVRRIARWVGAEPDRFAAAMRAMLGEDIVLARRASWVVTLCVERFPFLAEPWLGEMLRMAEMPDDALQRNMMRSFQFVRIPARRQGRVYNAAFSLLTSPRTSIAAKAFSITVLANIAEQEPDLARELLMVLDEMLAHPLSAGVLSRARKTVRRLSRSAA